MKINSFVWNNSKSDFSDLKGRQLRPFKNISVEPASYLEISTILKTSGCSAKSPNWVSSVCGFIRTVNGVHLVTPGDTINCFKHHSETVIFITSNELLYKRIL